MTPEQIITAINGGWLYETRQGELFCGCPVSQLPAVLRAAGWRNVGRDYSDVYALKDHGLKTVIARYRGGVRPKRFCDVVVARWYGFNPALHAFMMSQGATHQRFAASWEDVGDAENGPEMTGCQAYDEYTLDDTCYAAFEDGTVDRSPAFDTQGIECDAVG